MCGHRRDVEAATIEREGPGEAWQGRYKVQSRGDQSVGNVAGEHVQPEGAERL